eukprot:TRINITY_DN4003_c0_g2_i3.p1 TRINITY_DN4003_c0_g2~~TRINITY_DN4003_c0_g2_i3.p1  ORF type:complete len:205 (+),score=9.19 TRINITY_DN4003_c0_g2_i3:101-715(+)
MKFARWWTPVMALARRDAKVLVGAVCPMFQGIHCKGGPCPEFSSCTTEKNDTSPTKLLACSYEGLSDENSDFVPMHLLKRGLNNWTGQVFVLHNVFITGLGKIFDHQHLYEFPGDCVWPHGSPSLLSLASSIGEAATLASIWSGNYYHSIVELSGALIQIIPFLKKKPFIDVITLKARVSHAITITQKTYLAHNCPSKFKNKSL